MNILYIMCWLWWKYYSVVGYGVGPGGVTSCSGGVVILCNGGSVGVAGGVDVMDN